MTAGGGRFYGVPGRHAAHAAHEVLRMGGCCASAGLGYRSSLSCPIRFLYCSGRVTAGSDGVAWLVGWSVLLVHALAKFPLPA